MSFTKVNPAGWAVGDKLTSSQINALDLDHSRALDKTSAGDTIAGAVNFSGSGSIQANLDGAVQSTVFGGIVVNVASGLQTIAANGIQLAGGATDWPTFSTARTRSIAVPLTCPIAVCTATQPPGGFGAASYASANLPTFFGPGFQTNNVSAGSNGWAYVAPLTQLHNGATLSSAALWLTGSLLHAALPATMPAFSIFRYPISSGPATLTSLASSNFSTDPTALLATYDSLHSWSLTCNQNNVIDTTQYGYLAVIYDEAGANGQAINNYRGFILNYTNIPNMAFQ